jgi:hypothetical protein
MLWMQSEGLGDRQNSVFNISSLNPRFRQYRKQLHSGLNSRATQTYFPLINQERLVFLNGLATAPQDFISHTRRNAGAVVLKITYGWAVTSNDDKLVKRMQEAAHIGAEILRPGRWLVEIFPLLRFVPSWMPRAGFKRTAISAGQRLRETDTFPFNWTKEQITSGNYIESFISMGLHPEGGEPLSSVEADILRRCGAALYGGGADTVSPLSSLFPADIPWHSFTDCVCDDHLLSNDDPSP